MENILTLDMIKNCIKELDQRASEYISDPCPVFKIEYEILEKHGYDMSKYCLVENLPEYSENDKVNRGKFIPYHKQKNRYYESYIV